MQTDKGVQHLPVWRDRLAFALSAPVLLVHLLLAGRYDLFRDELYFIVCGQHPAFGYADQPPLVPLIAAGFYEVGGSAFWVRLPAALAAAALVFVAVRFARLLDGSRSAAVIAGICCAIAPIFMGLTAILSTSSFDPLAFTLIALLLVRADRRSDNGALVWAGLIAGITLQVKYSLLLWAAGVAIGIMLTPQRRLLARPALWLGLGLAGLIAAPSLVWQALNGWPFLALSAAAAGKNAEVALLPFIGNQAFILNPVLAPIALAGIVAPFLSARLAGLRFLSIAYVVTFAIVRLGHGKDYYLAACYPALLVTGAVFLAEVLRQKWQRRLGQAALGLAAIITVVAAPLALPVLSPDALAAYITRTGLAPQQQERNFSGTILPQVFADQLGWRDFSHQVEQAWARIPAEHRPTTAILVDNYGEAAALDVHAHGLPPALTGHNQYGLWGLRGQAPQDLLIVTDEPEHLGTYCDQVVRLGVTSSRHAMSYENGKTIAWCAGPKTPLQKLWPGLIRFE